MRKGFTMIELLIVVGIFVILGALAVPFGQFFQTSTNFDTTENGIVSALRRAQLRAASGLENSAWSVHFDANQGEYTVFLGSDFQNRDTGFDETDNFSPEFSLGTDFGLDLTFGRFTGLPSASGTVQLSGPTLSGGAMVSPIGRIQAGN